MLKQRTRADVLVRNVVVCLAMVLLAVGVAIAGDRGRAFGAAVALFVLVPLFWFLNHPRRRRRRLRAAATRD